MKKRRRRETTLEQWLAEEMQDREFRRAYKAAGAEITASKKLAAMGGSVPNMKAPRRRRLSRDLDARLVELVGQLRKIQAVARKLGLFAEDRELLTCHHCGLQEDIAIDGRLLVTVPGSRRCDTGLRFARVMRRSDWWRCPKCKSALKEPAPDFSAE